MSNKAEVATIEKPRQQVAAVTPAQMLQIAVEQNADLDKLEKLMGLQERWEAKEAKKAFFQALSDFQSLLPAIKKQKTVNFTTAKGTTNYMYAPLGDIVEQIREPLHAAGLSYRFKQQHTDTNISVTCIISHSAGHSECVEMHAGLDQTGNKNVIQGLGSTVTYLQRYTLCSGLGIATADSDMDGRLPQDTITEGQAASLKARLEVTGSNVQKFCQMLRVTRIEDLPSSQYAQADKMLTQKEAKVEVVNENSN